MMPATVVLIQEIERTTLIYELMYLGVLLIEIEWDNYYTQFMRHVT